MLLRIKRKISGLLAQDENGCKSSYSIYYNASLLHKIKSYILPIFIMPIF
jgi:hypothetical protein